MLVIKHHWNEGPYIMAFRNQQQDIERRKVTEVDSKGNRKHSLIFNGNCFDLVTYQTTVQRPVVYNQLKNGSDKKVM